MLKYLLYIVTLIGTSAFGQGPLLPSPASLKLNEIKKSYRVVGVIRENLGNSVIVLKNMKTMGTVQILAGSSLEGAVVDNSSSRSVKVSLEGRSLLMDFVEAEQEPAPATGEYKMPEIAALELESTVLEWDQAQEFKTMLEKQVKVSELSLDADRKLTFTENTVKVETRDCEVFIAGESDCYPQVDESFSE